MSLASIRSVAVGPRARLTPGRFLETRFLRPLNLTQEALAVELGVSRRRVNEIVRGRRGISADTALRLGRYFGTGPDLWLSLQHSWETHKARRRMPEPLVPQGRSVR